MYTCTDHDNIHEISGRVRRWLMKEEDRKASNALQPILFRSTFFLLFSVFLMHVRLPDTGVCLQKDIGC